MQATATHGGGVLLCSTSYLWAQPQPQFRTSPLMLICCRPLHSSFYSASRFATYCYICERVFQNMGIVFEYRAQITSSIIMSSAAAAVLHFTSPIRMLSPAAQQLPGLPLGARCAHVFQSIETVFGSGFRVHYLSLYHHVRSRCRSFVLRVSCREGFSCCTAASPQLPGVTHFITCGIFQCIGFAFGADMLHYLDSVHIVSSFS